MTTIIPILRYHALLIAWHWTQDPFGNGIRFIPTNDPTLIKMRLLWWLRRLLHFFFRSTIAPLILVLPPTRFITWIYCICTVGIVGAIPYSWFWGLTLVGWFTGNQFMWRRRRRQRRQRVACVGSSENWKRSIIVAFLHIPRNPLPPWCGCCVLLCFGSLHSR